MPAEDFIYGKRNRTPTPVKQVINNDYGNNGKLALTNMYNHFISSSMSQTKLAPKSTRTFNNRLEKVRANKQPEAEAEPYKMKLFSQVESKIKTGLKREKSVSYLDKANNLNDIDRLIQKV